MKKILSILFVFFAFALFSSEEKTTYSIFPSGCISFSENFYQIENISDNFFPDSLFTDRFSKLKLTTGLNAFYKSYKDFFYKIELSYTKNDFEVVFYHVNGEKYYFPTGRSENLPADRKYTPFFYRYYKGNKKTERGGIFFFGKINYDFFYSVYGKNSIEVRANLADVKIFGRILPFNSKNNAAFHLQEAVNEVEAVSKSDKEVMTWMSNLKLYTYSNRNVANENRPSLHSFGIAIDFVPKKYSKFIYWLWSVYFVSEWWKIEDSKKIKVPQKVIEIFEKNGFTWGGKWYRFDLMHFEYRPEILEDRIF